ncbi:hypothetical protein Sjap_011198 [Stephania japonica]|uniref:Uncharacterized protein n=1 Tax=Stephania japonica TaxID=461633 RepID=A0AAP0JCX2_9MAGN
MVYTQNIYLFHVFSQQKHDLKWPDLYSTVLNFESQLKQVNSVNSSLANLGVSPNANAAFVKNTNSKGVEGQWQFNGNANGSGTNNGRGGFTGHKGTRGKGRGRGNNSNRPVCQICSKTGHTTAVCYYRNDYSYMGRQAQAQ